MRRLLPALVVVLAGCAVLTILIQPETRWETFADQSLASLGYYQNWELASTVADYLRAGESVSPLQHIWSMSVQGQFYIAFLALVFGFAYLLRRRLGDRLRTAFVLLLSALAIASFVYAIFAHQDDQAVAYYNSFARAWELLLGALVGALVPYIRWPMWLRDHRGHHRVGGGAVLRRTDRRRQAVPRPVDVGPRRRRRACSSWPAPTGPTASRCRYPTGCSRRRRWCASVRWPTRCICGTGRC